MKVEARMDHLVVPESIALAPENIVLKVNNVEGREMGVGVVHVLEAKSCQLNGVARRVRGFFASKDHRKK
jgi:hypothetical protein